MIVTAVPVLYLVLCVKLFIALCQVRKCGDPGNRIRPFLISVLWRKCCQPQVKMALFRGSLARLIKPTQVREKILHEGSDNSNIGNRPLLS